MRIPYLLVFCTMMLMTPVPSSATTMFHVSDLEQAQKSDAVVIATIGTAKTGPHPNKKSIMTETNILVEEVLAGNAPRFLTIRQMGGTLNGKTMYVPGDARLNEGKKVVLFLHEENGHWYLTAMEQSKYELSHHARLGWVMKRELHGGLVVRTSEGRLAPFKPPKKKPIQTLTEFKNTLRKGGVQ